MCRLFAYVAPESRSAAHELGEAGLSSLESLARLHGDGWGWSGVAAPGTTPETSKSWRSAAEDPEFRTVLSSPARSAMVHLRWATTGLPVEQCNAHPFQVDGLSFEHNGSIKPLHALRALLPQRLRDDVEGATDSELYFALIRERVDLGVPVAEAACAVASRLRAEFPTSSLNAMLLDGDHLVVIHASARSALPDDDLEEIAAMTGLPDEHLEDYFALRWHRDGDGTVLVGSTGVAGPDWATLQPESVTAFRIDDGSFQTLALHPAMEHTPLTD
jgi:glutamine amidotransferase